MSRVCGTQQETVGWKDASRELRLTPKDNFFSFGSCSYTIKKSKECTARVVVHRELQLATSYTLEASFCGCDERRAGRSGEEAGAHDDSSSSGPAGAPSSDSVATGGGFHFSSGHLQQIGYRFCKALHVYFGLGVPPNAESKLEEPPGLPTIASIDGIHQLPDNSSVHAAIIELMQGDVDAGPDGDSEGSDGGDASDSEPTDAPALAPASSSAKKGTGANDGSQHRVAAPPQPKLKTAAAATEAPEPRRRNSVSTRRTREAEMRAAAQRAEAAAAAAAALLGNRPDLLSGISFPPPRPAIPSQSRPEHPMPPPPLIQQPSVLLEQQRQNAQHRMLQQQQQRPQPPQPLQQQFQPPQKPLSQQQPPPPPHPGDLNYPTPNTAPNITDGFGLTGVVDVGGAATGAGPALLPSRCYAVGPPSHGVGGGEIGGAAGGGQVGGLDADDEGDGSNSTDGDVGPDGSITRGASFERGRGFSGKSLSLRSNQQWVARPRPGQSQGPVAAAAARAPAMAPAESTENRQRQPPGGTLQQGSLAGGGPVTAPAASPGAALKSSQPMLKRRPHLPSATSGEGVLSGEEMMQLGQQSGSFGTHSTPFAELIARRGGEAARQASNGVGSGAVAVDGNEQGLVAGLELLVSNVRRANGTASAGGEGNLDGSGHIGPGYDHVEQHSGGFGGRSKSSPVAGRRAMPPSANISALAGLSGVGADGENGEDMPPGGDSLNSTEVDDAIYSFAASLRAQRRSCNGANDAVDDELMMGSADGARDYSGREHDGSNGNGGGLAGIPASASYTVGAGCGRGGLSLPVGSVATSAIAGPPGCALPYAVQQGTNQVLSAAARQRWSARENDRAAPTHNPLPFGKEGGPSLVIGAGAAGASAAGLGLSQSMTGNVSWPPRTWHSFAHNGGSTGGGGLGASSVVGAHNANNSRPRSVESGARPLDSRGGIGVPTTRRTAYYSQPTSDPRLVLQPNGGGQQYFG